MKQIIPDKSSDGYRYYGNGYGDNQAGRIRENLDLCAAEVITKEAIYGSRQCLRKREDGSELCNYHKNKVKKMIDSFINR